LSLSIVGLIVLTINCTVTLAITGFGRHVRKLVYSLTHHVPITLPERK
jgi:hypothetical protein